MNILCTWIHALLSAGWYLELFLLQLWSSAMKGSRKAHLSIVPLSGTGTGLVLAHISPSSVAVVPHGGGMAPVSWKQFSREGGAVRLSAQLWGLGGAVPASIVHHLHCLGQLAFHIKFTLYRLSCSGMLGDHCYGLNCVPQNSYVEALTPNTSEYGYIWRQGLQKGDQVKEAIRMGLNPTGWYP